jgi:hypothetical protein
VFVGASGTEAPSYFGRCVKPIVARYPKDFGVSDRKKRRFNLFRYSGQSSNNYCLPRQVTSTCPQIGDGYSGCDADIGSP